MKTIPNHKQILPFRSVTSELFILLMISIVWWNDAEELDDSYPLSIVHFVEEEI